MEDRIEEVIFYAIDHVYRNKQNYAQRKFSEHNIDITPEQWVVLKVVYQYEGIPQVELAEKSAKDTASITRILDILQKKNLIERQPSNEDRRKYCIHPTQSGKQLVDDSMNVVLGLRKEAVASISAKDLDTTMKVLEKIKKNIE